MHNPQPLRPPDSLHLSAAEGWLELGNQSEANAELEAIPVALRLHPDVLEVRWGLFAKAGNWEACLETAKAITELAPDRPLGWVRLSYALHKQGRTSEARRNLAGVAGRFRKVPSILYNLACYSCCLGDMDEAERLLRRALKHEDAKALNLMALEDLDLEPLWKQIREL